MKKKIEVQSPTNLMLNDKILKKSNLKNLWIESWDRGNPVESINSHINSLLNGKKKLQKNKTQVNLG